MTDSQLDRYRQKAKAEFGRGAHVSEPIGFGRMGLAWTIERTINGRFRRYHGLTFDEAMDNARNDRTNE